MSVFSRKELTVLEWGGSAVAVLGLLVALFTYIPHDPDSFWHELIIGLRGTGWVASGTGLMWAALALAHNRTNFFSVQSRIDSQVFGISMAVIAVVAVVTLTVLFNKMPLTPKESLPGDPQVRARIVKQEGALRGVIIFAVLGTSAVIGSFPVRRVLRG